MKSLLCALFACFLSVAHAVPVATVPELLAAAAAATPGTHLRLAPGTYALPHSLELKGGVTLEGAGVDKTILTHTATWQASPASLPDPEMRLEGLDTTAYLIIIQRDQEKAGVSHLTLLGPQVHGGIFSWFHTGLHLHHLRIQDTQWCGIRTFGMKQARIHDCEFIHAGIRWEKGAPGLKGGNTGGGIFACWMSDTEIYNNRFRESRKEPYQHYYGIKGRQARRVRLHHNTIEAGFSIELPFENDEDVEIDHNILHAPVSIPKYAGGPVPASGRTFHIHHNYFTDGYSIEFVRNGVEISHNLFDFDPKKDGSNLIGAFGDKPAAGPAVFHNNLVNNPGRGVIWMNEPYAFLTVRNNHIIARTTQKPRTEGLFGFHTDCDFKTFRFTQNIIECQGTPRPLFRNPQSAASVLEHNLLTNITDTALYPPQAPHPSQPAGLEKPLAFACGVDGELLVDGWKTRPAPR